MPTNRAQPKNSLALPVLSLLMERPMHPYEMKILMLERGHDQVVRLKGGSLYDTVERLTNAGLIEATETNRDGRRPERTVYAITDAGRDVLSDWLRDMLAVPVNDYPQFVAALAFIAVLPEEEWVPLLSRRLVAMEAGIGADEAVMRTVQERGIPRIFTIEGEYVLAVHRAELEWLKGIVADMKEGRLKFPTAKVLQSLNEMSEVWRRESES